MKGIFSTLLFLTVGLVVLVGTGILDGDQLLEFVAGEVTMGETTQIFDESAYRKRFDLIVGEVDVHDTSTTAVERNALFCDKAYIVTVTHATIKYQVAATPELFYINAAAKEYFISPDLDVSLIEADKKVNTTIKESTCIKERHVSAAIYDNARELAADNFQHAISTSDKIVEARAEFDRIKQSLVADFEAAGFAERRPTPPLPN